MGFPFNITNPGILIPGLLTAAEQEFVTDLFTLPYATGDILYYNGTDLTRRGIGSPNQVLTVTGGVPVWATPATGFADPLTTNGDIIARIGGTTTRLAQGGNGTYLGVSGGVLGYYTPSGGGSGDVVGPASATDNAIVRFDTTTGKLIQNSVVTIGDTGSIDGALSVGIGKTSSASIRVEVKADSTFTQGVRVEADSLSRLGFSGFVTGDSFVRYTQGVGGAMEWGTGAAVADTQLSRTGVAELTTNAKLIVTGGLKITNLSTVGHVWTATDTIGNGQWQASSAGGGFTWQGQWLTATGYVANDIVRNGSAGYVCILGHTSGSTSEPGVGASWTTYWDLFVQDGVGSAGIIRSVVSTSGSATMGAAASTDYVYLVTGAHTMTLPTAVGNTNSYNIKNNHSANITVNTTSSQTIDGTTSITIAPQENVEVISNNSNWSIL